MLLVLFPSGNSGCYMSNGGDVSGNQYGFKSLEGAKKAAEAFLRTNAYVQALPIVILDTDTLQIVSSVAKVPSPLPWVDHRF